MASEGTVAQVSDAVNDRTRFAAKSPGEQGCSPVPDSHIPRSLLYSEAHGDLAVLIWADYESLMTPALGGGRAPSVAGRAYIADTYGTSPTVIDDARRQLLRDVPGGAYLARSSPRGRKRTVQHMARRRPQETRERYVPVPAWTRTLVWAGSRRPAGRISPSAWRLYASAVDRATRDSTVPAPFETTVATLSRTAGRGSADTGRRRLAELERAGLMHVTAALGGRLTVLPITDPDEAAEVAKAYAEHGRTVVDPPQNPALTPRKIRHSPPAKSGTPCTQPSGTQPPTTQPHSPAVGELQVPPARAHEAADAAENQRSEREQRPAAPRRERPAAATVEAAALYRRLPERLRAAVPGHGVRRVLRAITAELKHRTVVELAERIDRRAEAWRWRVEDVADATAVAIIIVRRGYDCVDVRCEDHSRLDTGADCTHCATTARHGDQADAAKAPPQALTHCGDTRHIPGTLLLDSPTGPRRCPRCHPHAVPETTHEAWDHELQPDLSPTAVAEIAAVRARMRQQRSAS